MTAAGSLDDRALGAFLFTDIESSTPLWSGAPEAMSTAVRRHDQLLDAIVAANGGLVFTRAGDSYAVRFDDVGAAIDASTAMQDAMAAESGPPQTPIRIRIGIHVGPAEHRAGDWFGPTVNTAARVMSAGHGGQVLLTAAARALAPGLAVRELGAVELRGLSEPISLFQLVPDREFPPLRGVHARRVRLPTFSTPLFGREAEIAEVRSAVEQHRLVTIVGLGGMGKTRLAVAAAEKLGDVLSGGVTFVDLSTVPDEDGIVPAILGALEVTAESDDVLAEYLAAREILLVLDNCEHLVDAVADLVDNLLALAPRLKILATSRERLDLAGEQVLHTRPLATGEGSPGRSLFLDRALLIDPGFAPDETEVRAIDEITERLDGLPLAIELAAARIPVLAPAELVAGLDDRFRLLTAGRRRRRTSREHTLRATLEWSYDLLDDDERSLLRILSIFSGSFDADAVAAVAQLDAFDAVDLLGSLYDKCLIAAVTAGGSRRFRLLETVRVFATELLVADSREADRIGARHTEYYLERASDLSHAGRLDLDRSVEMERDIANLDQAIDALAVQGRWDDVATITVSSNGLSWNRGRSAEVGRWATAVLAHAAEIPPEKLALVHSVQASVLMDRTRFAEMTRHVEAALELSEDPVLDSISEVQLAVIDLALPEAVADAQRLHAMVQKLQQCTERSGARESLLLQVMAEGWVDLQRGDHRAAIARLEPVELGSSHYWEMAVTDVLAVARMLDGDPAAAVALLDDGAEASLMSSREVLRAVAVSLLGKIDEAVEQLRIAGERAALGQMPLVEYDVLMGLGWLALAEGDVETAGRYSLSICRNPLSNHLCQRLAEEVGLAETRNALAGALIESGTIDGRIPSGQPLLYHELTAGRLAR